MKNSACKALVCLVTVALSSCAGVGGNQSPVGEAPESLSSNTSTRESPPVDSISENGEQTTSLAVENDGNSFTESLVKNGDVPFGMSFTASSGVGVLEIDPGVKSMAYTVSRLNSPERLILDLSGATIKKSQTISPSSQEIVSNIRLGSHGADTRVVLDLAKDATDSVRTDGNKIIVSLSTNGEQIPVVAKAAPALVEDVAPVQVAQASPSIGAPKLTGLAIENVPGHGNAVVADIPQLRKFELVKTAPSEYVASVTGATLDPAIKQTVLAAPNSGAIRSVRPMEKNGDVVLRIFAQPEAELVAAAEGGRLVIKDVLDSPEFMAQEKVEPQLQGAAKPPTPPEAPVAKKESVTAGSKTEPLKEVSKSTPAITNDDVSALLGGDQKYSGRLISLDLQDTDIDNALRIIAEVSNLNIIASSDVQGKVTLRLIDVPWDQALDVILKTNGLDKVQEGNVVRIAPVEKLRLERESLKQAQLAEDELEPLSVKYVRVSYAKALDLKPLIKSVLTERGDVSVDERSNQLIVKDIHKGIRNAVDLINKLDLRTPQVLLETQIVEATRSLLRDLGAQLGFSYIQSPETGNPTGFNFPNSIKIGGGIPGSTSASAFPAAISGTEGSAISMVFGSADGTRGLDANISALEKEGRVRIVSRPSVATTNNKTAEITSNETISIRKPNGGSNTVVGGSGGIAGGDTATEKIKAGITLKVTPQASPDYYVLMDIIAESSTLGSKVFDGIPSVVERKATSTVLVSSGQTFAIGGIYRLVDQDTVSGMPFFKDIPVLGHFFRRAKVDNSDEELLFFITPRIIEGSFDDAAMSTGTL